MSPPPVLLDSQFGNLLAPNRWELFEEAGHGVPGFQMVEERLD